MARFAAPLEVNAVALSGTGDSVWLAVDGNEPDVEMVGEIDEAGIGEPVDGQTVAGHDQAGQPPDQPGGARLPPHGGESRQAR